MRGSAQPQTIDLPPLDIRAAIGTVDEEARTVELIWSTGAAVERYDWFTDKRYLEKLSLDPKHVRLGRLNDGGPLLDSHSAWSVTDQLGSVVPGSVRLMKGEARCTVRFSRRPSVDELWQDVRDGIVRSVSVGYRVHKFQEDAGGENKLPVRTAIDWEPYEVSMVSMPADAGAKTRAERGDLNPCVVITREEKAMEERQDGLSMTIDEGASDRREATREDATEREERLEPSAIEAAVTAERERCQGILAACRAARMPSKMYDEFVAKKTPLVDAQRQIFEELERRGGQRSDGPNPAARRVEMGDDPLIHKRAGMEEALLHRTNPEKFPLTDKAREYRGMSLLDMAKVHLNARGIRTTDMSRMEIAGVALGCTQVRSAGLHSTSDFPLLLADVASKSLREQYQAAPQTFMPITKIGSVPDFRTANRVQIGDAPALKPVGEHGEFTRGTVEEAREQVSAATYGRVFGITRQALVNDDTDAFARMPALFGRMARNLESDLVWYQILKNANMGDGNALFSAAHSNYVAAGDIDLTVVGAAEKAMLLQTGIDASTLIVAQPKYLIVGPTKKLQAQQFVAQTVVPTSIANANPYAGQLTVIVEPRLETGINLGGGNTATGSAYAWYLASDKSQIDIVELVFLEGQSGPVIDTRIGFDVDGFEIRCRHDVGAKVIDWRGLYKSDGSDNS